MVIFNLQSYSRCIPWKHYLDANNTCFHETMKAVHSWPWWLEWLEGCGCWVNMLVLVLVGKQGSQSWEHTSEKPICSLCQVLMGRNPSASILRAAPTDCGHTNTMISSEATRTNNQTPPAISWDMQGFPLICSILFSTLTLWHQNGC